MPQSAELAGGEGFTFEGNAVAFYLTALLAEAFAPGIDHSTVVRVSVQQRDFGEPLDDVIVDFEDAALNSARLSLQVKRALTISAASTNNDFREVMRDSWATLKKANFRTKFDRYGVAVGAVAAAKERALGLLCDWARESLTTNHFDARFGPGGNASDEITAVKNDIVELLNEVAEGTACSNEDVRQFLAHFVLIRFDFLREGATGPPDAINRIRDCLAPGDATKAPLVWSRFVELARASAGKSGQFDRGRLVRAISPVARLRGATSLQHDLTRLAELAKNHAELISDDVGGTRLERPTLLANVDTKLATSRAVQIRGLPGSGKSVVVRRVVQRALAHGPVLFVKAEQLEGTSWISYATAHGISGAPLDLLLLEIGAVGTPILFIDAIDRVEKAQQPIILDLIRAIVASPLLDNWRVVVSLRDSGIELLRNWLGELLDVLKVETLSVGQLSDEEATTLANAKPHLEPLLFGSSQVREIVRRPFFAKVLHQSYVAEPGLPTFAPRSEVDLIANWWRRGGYNESGQSAIERQQALLDLASVRSRQLSQPIRLAELASVAHIHGLLSDGILQHAREGISVRFAHDIFFEWAFFHVLADRGVHWMDEIKACGEPPAVARVVELLSQWEYAPGEHWPAHLAQAERSDLRSQWLRAWLLGPLGTARFEVDENQFATATFADDFRLFRKSLVWFQAEKTSPNPNVLVGDLPPEKRQRFADYLGWPSDFAAWRRFIHFILRHISIVPQRLYPEIVAIFEVWQNAVAHLRNPTSEALLQQCANWLAAIDAINALDRPDASSEYWGVVPGLGDLRKSLRGLLLRSSRAEPKFAADYLQRVANTERIRDEVFHDSIAYSSIVSKSLPQAVVELSLAYLRRELPDDQVARERKELDDAAEWREAILAKPEAERTRREQMALSSPTIIRGIGDFSYHDWDRLSIDDDFHVFWPPSPLREPFHSLFQSSPEEALRLLRELCNHAISAWQQLHCYSRDRGGTPIALKLTFPWGTQDFWGTDREYLWFRSTWAPKAIACGFMALEEWCFAELERGRSVDDLIRQVVEGNKCIAILGIAAMLALHTENLSEATAPLVISQRLLAADHNRWAQDLAPGASLMGFTSLSDKSHMEAIQAANARPVRKIELRWLIPRFVFATGQLSNRTREAILNFKNDLPFQYEEQRDNMRIREQLTTEAREYAELVDPNNYKAYRTEEDSDRIAIVHVSPSAAKPENVARVEEASRHLKQMGLWMWASESIEKRAIQDSHIIGDAIELAKEVDSDDLFDHATDDNEAANLPIRRGAVAATAAVVLIFRDGRGQEDFKWARDVLKRAIRLTEKPDLMWSPGSIIPWHPAIFVARGLAADLREGTAELDATRELFELIAHPLEIVSLAAVSEACQLWSRDPKLTWSALWLALSLCHVPPRPRDEIPDPRRPLHSFSETQAAVDAAHVFYNKGSGWTPLPLPPPAWVKIKPRAGWHPQYEDYDTRDATDPTDVWGEPEVYWHSMEAAKILKCVPLPAILTSDARTAFLDFLANILDWTNQKNAPPWVKSGRRNRSANHIFEWTHSLGSKLGVVAGLIPLSEFKVRFLAPVLALEGGNCWALLSPFASSYVCAYIYDSPVVPPDAIATLDLCLGRLLEDTAFTRDSYRSGEFSGFDQPELVRTLMFVSVERAALAARYVNGDWTEIDRILPLVDRFVRAGGWAAAVMDPYLTLCERAKTNYPAEVFADQILAIVVQGPENLKGWHGTFIPARIAELVQYFAHRETPMAQPLALKFLRVLDILVDMGDRRSAALQLGEAFREIRLPC